MELKVLPFDSCPRVENETALGIGIFDGVHLGHQKIIQAIKQEAFRRNLSSAILTFHPHPDQFFGQHQIHLIQTLKQRKETIGRLSIENVIVLNFDKSFATLSGKDFVRLILLEKFRTKIIVVGDNFRFGKNREGNTATLQLLGKPWGFKVITIPSVKLNNHLVSSSKIRELLIEGNIQEANRFLGRPYQIEGRVITGSSRGKSIGYPTANLATKNHLFLRGVFVSEVSLNNSRFPALTNIGHCPTFEGKSFRVECHIINYKGDLYGKEVKIDFLKKIRDESKFNSPQALALQIKKDIEEAKKYFFEIS
ncbi:MAG: bifunctional riboflavin kinase/FAD synthetase [Acidobacteriota bacterium]